MPSPSGLSSQVGMAKESNYGVYAAPATFFPWLSDSLDIERDRIESEAVVAGRLVQTSGQWQQGNIKVGGDLGFEFYDRSAGKLLEQIFGSASTSGSGPYTHTFRPGTLPSATWQLGRPANDATVYPFTVTGAKVASAEIAAKVGENATMGLTLVAQNGSKGTRSVSDGVTTNSSTTVTSSTGAFTAADIGKIIAGTNIPTGATIVGINSSTSVTISSAATGTGSSITLTIGAALASASYASSQTPYRAGKISLSIGGSEMYPSEATIKIDNGLADDRRYLGSDTIREPLPADLRTYTAELKCEFDSLTSWDAFTAGTEAAFSMVLTSPASSSYTCTISGNCRYDKASEAASGRGILEKSVAVKFVASTSNDYSALQAVVVNGDSSV